MNRNKQLKTLKKIGIQLFCSEEDFNYLTPNFPILKGNEFIISISWANTITFIDSEVEELIKGLHIVETLFKHKTNNDFGFGSPSPTFKIIQQINNKDQKLAIFLTQWIAHNGGNYYIRHN